jgi:hypothetical protein
LRHARGEVRVAVALDAVLDQHDALDAAEIAREGVVRIDREIVRGAVVREMHPLPCRARRPGVGRRAQQQRQRHGEGVHASDGRHRAPVVSRPGGARGELSMPRDLGQARAAPRASPSR